MISDEFLVMPEMQTYDSAIIVPTLADNIAELIQSILIDSENDDLESPPNESLEYYCEEVCLPYTSQTVIYIIEWLQTDSAREVVLDALESVDSRLLESSEEAVETALDGIIGLKYWESCLEVFPITPKISQIDQTKTDEFIRKVERVAEKTTTKAKKATTAKKATISVPSEYSIFNHEKIDKISWTADLYRGSYYIGELKYLNHRITHNMHKRTFDVFLEALAKDNLDMLTWVKDNIKYTDKMMDLAENTERMLLYKITGDSRWRKIIPESIPQEGEELLPEQYDDLKKLARKLHGSKVKYKFAIDVVIRYFGY